MDDRTKLLQDVGLITDPNNQVEVYATAMALKGFDSKQIMEAYVYHKQVSPFPMKVCDVVNYWKQKFGMSDAQLESKAALIYDQYFKHPKTGFDHVCDDKRVAYAFRVAFGTLSEFGDHDPKYDALDRKEFIKAYVNATPGDYELCPPVIAGRNHTSLANDTVILVGNQDKALGEAKKLYGEQVKISYQKPKTVTPELGYKPLHARVATEAEQAANVKKLKDILGKFVNSMTR